MESERRKFGIVLAFAVLFATLAFASVGCASTATHHVNPWESIQDAGNTTPSAFDTGPSKNPYPSIMGTHNGTIKPSHDVVANKMYTYPSVGTCGHSEYVKIYNETFYINASWDGYGSDYHNITFPQQFTLLADHRYNYTIITGSYPQIIHEHVFNTTSDGEITGTKFIDANEKSYDDWIPAIRLEVKEGMKPMITLSSDPDDDLLFYVTGEDGLFAYYYGFKSNDTMRLTHVIFENTTGNVEVVIFNDDFLPVQWILTNMTVVVYKLGEEPFDPHSAFHVAVYGDQEDNATIDIYPSNLSAVIDEMESETGQNFDNARAFLGKYNITTFDELVTIAQQSSPEQPRFIAAATGFSTSAAALSLAKENVTSASAGDVRSAAYAAVFKPVVEVAAGALAHIIARELDYGLGDPTGPVVDVLLCRGVAKYGICHYLFLRQGIMHCVSICLTSLKCYTDICMPMEISAEVADRFIEHIS